MIPLERKEPVKKKYREWYRDNKKKLEDHFSVYLKHNKNGWVQKNHKKVIRKYLVETSPQKCAYCERIPNQGGGNLEIEHFYPKSNEKYSHMVFKFENLLLSCTQCNKAKGQRFEEEGVEIIDPYKEKNITPHLILNLEDMTLIGKSVKGKVTVMFLNKPLNTSKFLHDGEIQLGAVHVRKAILRGINDKLAGLKKYRHDPGYLYDELKALLDMLDERESVTAARATVLLNNPVFFELLERLKESDKDKYDELCRIAESKKHFCLSISRI